jgi:hypothetical protein
MSCLNPLDPQTIRVFSTEGSFQTVCSGTNAGQNRSSVLVFPSPQNAAAEPRACLSYDPYNQAAATEIVPTFCAAMCGAERGNADPKVLCFPQSAPSRRTEARGSGNVAFMLDSFNGNSMRSPNPHSGHRVTEVTGTITTFVPDPGRKHGGTAILSFPQTANSEEAKCHA